MAVVIDHTLVPVRDKEESASFLARILGLPYEPGRGHFAPVRVGETLLDFDTREDWPRLHFAFKVNEEEFDGVLARLKLDEVPFGAEHDGTYNGLIKERAGGRGIYFPDPCGHSWEVITATYQG